MMRLKSVDMILVLSDKIKDILIQNSKSRTIAYFKIQRSNIILLAAEGHTNQYISEIVGLHYNNVAI